jgi:hypothetical protein
MNLMRIYSILSFCLLLLLSSCEQEDRFTGLGNKDYNQVADAAAYPSWIEKGNKMVDTTRIKSPMFLRIKKEMGFYVMNCYQFDAAQNMVVRDVRIFDFVNFTQADENTLISDNEASHIMSDKRIIIKLDPAKGTMTMSFSIGEDEKPNDEIMLALFRTMFSSGFNKLMEVRRKAEDAKLIDSKLKSDHLILAD